MLVLTVIFSVLPLVLVFRRSFYKGNIFDTDLKFSGLANYRDVFSTGGGHALRITAIYTVGFVVVCMAVGLAIALLLDVRLPGLSFVRAVFVIPLVVPAVATALIWYTLFQPDTGLFNRVLSGVGLPQTSLDSKNTALVAVIAFGAWQFFGEVVILYLAALKSLPGRRHRGGQHRRGRGVEAADLHPAAPDPQSDRSHRRRGHPQRTADLHPDLRAHQRRAAGGDADRAVLRLPAGVRARRRRFGRTRRRDGGHPVPASPSWSRWSSWPSWRGLRGPR